MLKRIVKKTLKQFFSTKQSLRSLLILLSILAFPCAQAEKNHSSHHNNPLKDKTILWIDSYHQGYPWSDGTESGLRSVLTDTGIRFELIRMNTRTKSSVEAQTQAGRLVRKRIETLKPDLIIASDDPAQIYAVLPYLLDKNIPIVFTGVNWDAKPYGYPRKGITGMIEVDAIDTLVRHMDILGHCKRFALIGSDDASQDKNIAHYLLEHKTLFPSSPIVAKVKSYDEFQKRFLELQTEVDGIILLNSTTMRGWSTDKALPWVQQNTKVITGTLYDWMANYAVITVAKIPSEQGAYAGKTAIRILQGATPESIPLVTNEQFRLYLNKPLADQLGIVFPLPLLRASSPLPTPP